MEQLNVLHPPFRALLLASLALDLQPPVLPVQLLAMPVIEFCLERPVYVLQTIRQLVVLLFAHRLVETV